MTRLPVWPEYLSVTTAASYTGFSQRSIREWKRKGWIRFHEFRGKQLCRRRDLDILLTGGKDGDPLDVPLWVTVDYIKRFYDVSDGRLYRMLRAGELADCMREWSGRILFDTRKLDHKFERRRDEVPPEVALQSP